MTAREAFKGVGKTMALGIFVILSIPLGLIDPSANLRLHERLGLAVSHAIDHLAKLVDEGMTAKEFEDRGLHQVVKSKDSQILFLEKAMNSERVRQGLTADQEIIFAKQENAFLDRCQVLLREALRAIKLLLILHTFYFQKVSIL